MWELSDDYKYLKVLNDNSERGVDLIKEYNSIITKKENQKQCLLQIVHDHRRKFPECKKDLIKNQKMVAIRI